MAREPQPSIRLGLPRRRFEVGRCKTYRLTH